MYIYTYIYIYHITPQGTGAMWLPVCIYWHTQRMRWHTSHPARRWREVAASLHIVAYAAYEAAYGGIRLTLQGAGAMWLPF